MTTITFHYKNGKEVKDMSKVKVPIKIQMSLIEGITGRKVELKYETKNS